MELDVNDRITRAPTSADVTAAVDGAALENPTRASWVLTGGAAACFAIALYTSRFFH